ncbi:hypothetical protein LR48_Vigan05g086900 [Vigna angularis]|uniref:Uncharacterized protein n=1 Tax=Phaseolus angularis TaxID=3914 RepID=A0A0L9UK47_PHAAN|nr:hypothetical protein LR48_Vigan05g086900 [Vigna angularis]
MLPFNFSLLHGALLHWSTSFAYHTHQLLAQATSSFLASTLLIHAFSHAASSFYTSLIIQPLCFLSRAREASHSLSRAPLSPTTDPHSIRVFEDIFSFFVIFPLRSSLEEASKELVTRTCVISLEARPSIGTRAQVASTRQR